MLHMISLIIQPQNDQQRSEVIALIPHERAHVKQLSDQGIIQHVYIGTDNSKIWIVMSGDSPVAVQQQLQTFPLYPHMQQVEITPLQ